MWASVLEVVNRWWRTVTARKVEPVSLAAMMEAIPARKQELASLFTQPGRKIQTLATRVSAPRGVLLSVQNKGLRISALQREPGASRPASRGHISTIDNMGETQRSNRPVVRKQPARVTPPARRVWLEERAPAPKRASAAIIPLPASTRPDRGASRRLLNRAA